jgi:hypothetical protein
MRGGLLIALVAFITAAAAAAAVAGSGVVAEPPDDSSRLVEVAARSRARYEAREHQGACTLGAQAPELSALLRSAGVDFSLVPSEPLTVTLEDLECVSQEDLTGKDDLKMEVFVDGTLKATISERMGTGDKKKLGKVFHAEKEVKIVLFEKDWDPDDLLGKFVIGAPTTGSAVGSFTQGANYKLKYKAARGKSTSASSNGELLGFDTKEGRFSLTYGDICALVGDFFAGNPKTDAIGTDMKTGTARDEAGREKMFMQLFEGWTSYITTDKYPGKKLMTGRLLAIFDKERAAIERYRDTGKPGQLAYQEDHKWGAGKTINHVTNSHNNNLAEISNGGDEDVDYHGSAGFIITTYNRKGYPFYENAVYNVDHFAEGNALDVWRTGHRLAVEAALAARSKKGAEQLRELKRALSINGMADHFGTDLFASGHMRTKRRSLLFSAKDLKCSAEDVGTAASFWHDEDNQFGLMVDSPENKKRGLKPFRAYGDKMGYTEVNKINFGYTIEFVTASIKEVLEAFVSGKKPSGTDADGPARFIPQPIEGNHAPLFKVDSSSKVWVHRYTPPGQTPKYESDWECGAILLGKSMSDRNDDRKRMSDSVLAKDAEILKIVYEQMDARPKDKKVTLEEFCDWVVGIKPEAKTVEGRLIAVRLFNRFLRDTTRKHLIIADFDYMLMARSVAGQHGILTLRDYVLISWREEVEKASFEKTMQMLRENRGRGNDFGPRQNRRPGAFDVNWDEVKNMEIQVASKPIKSLGPTDAAQQMRTLQILGLLPREANVEDLLGYLDKQISELGKVKESDIRKSLDAEGITENQWIGYLVLDATAPVEEDSRRAEELLKRDGRVPDVQTAVASMRILMKKGLKPGMTLESAVANFSDELLNTNDGKPREQRMPVEENSPNIEV